MGDDDRRVEPRDGIIGSGMLTEPERIEQIEAERARKERAWRERKGPRFGEVLEKTPPKPSERTDVYVPADERRPRPTAPDEDTAEGEPVLEVDEDTGEDVDLSKEPTGEDPAAVSIEELEDARPRSTRGRPMQPSLSPGEPVRTRDGIPVVDREVVSRLPPDPRQRALHARFTQAPPGPPKRDRQNSRSPRSTGSTENRKDRGKDP